MIKMHRVLLEPAMPLQLILLLIYMSINFNQPSHHNIDYTHDNRFNLCTDSQPESYCECVFGTSKMLEDNDKILDIFINSKNQKLVFKMFDDLISGDAYNYHVFRSRKDKSEFVRGKMELFLAEVKRRCGS